MSGLDRYQAYSDSTVEWVGPIPDGWSVLPFFRFAKQCKRSNRGMLERNLLSLSYGKIIRKDIDGVDGLLPESFETYQVVEPNDLIFRLTDLQNDKHSLRSALCPERGIITSAYLAVSSSGIVVRYLAYLMRAYDLTKVFYSLGSGLRQSLKYDEMKRLPLLVPSRTEQLQIARFLDYETTRIDALIEKQQQLIALLKEKRQAVISHAVTKGLNPNAPLRDSGVEWLGMVPTHWEMLPIRHALRIDNGPRLPINREERAKISGPYPYWGPTGVLDYIDHFRYDGERVIIGEDGDHFLKFAIWPMTHWATGKFNVNNHAHVVATGAKCSARWFYYAFLHRDLGGDVIAQGVSRLKLTREGLSKLILAVPPLDEQLDLIAYIEPVIAKVEAATAKAERQIELLQERRTALISAAVTGKIDVHNWTPPELKPERDVA